MKNADDAIGKVMAGLGQAEAVPGLARRVEEGVRRKAAQGRALGGRSTAWWGGWRSGLGFGCAAALLLLLTMSVRRAQKHDTVVDKRSAKSQATRSAAALVGENRVVEPSDSVLQRRNPGLRPVRGRTAEAAPVSRMNLAQDPGRVQGYAEKVEAVSFPAPPMPLTEQERLLLRIANHGGPEEVAMLDRSGRAMQDAIETAVFQDFFGKPERIEEIKQKTDQGETR